jgi:hypothetical protein
MNKLIMHSYNRLHVLVNGQNRLLLNNETRLNCKPTELIRHPYGMRYMSLNGLPNTEYNNKRYSYLEIGA